MQGLDVTGRKVGYRIACESLRKSLEGWTETRGHYLADGVVVSPLLEMRSLPFRVVFLCGLGEGRFPAAGGPDPLDLTLANRSAGDVSPRERDKYLFLETLMCAHDQLYLSYVDRDAQTADPLEPSPVVNELMRHLAADGRALRRRSGSTNNPCDGSIKTIFPTRRRGKDRRGLFPTSQPPRGQNGAPAGFENRCAITVTRCLN